MGKNLAFSFLGSRDKTEVGTYTPLIIPSINSSGDSTAMVNNAASIKGQQIPFSDLSTSERTQSGFTYATPFSRIKNYYFKKIQDGNFNNMKTELIDIVKDYMWTISPQTAKTGSSDYSRAASDNNRSIADEVPYVQIKEKYFLVNNLIAQALYSISAANNIGSNLTGTTATGSIQKATDNLQGFLQSVAGTSSTALSQSGIGGVEQGPQTEAEAAAEAAEFRVTQPLQETGGKSGFFSNLAGEAKKLFIALKQYQDPDLEEVLFPYQRLYFVGPTGFSYKIPYFDKNAFNHSNAFGDSGAGNPALGSINKLMETIPSLAEAVQSVVNVFSQAGSAQIERTKYYQYQNTSQPIVVKFPLYNTTPATYSDICNNFKLVFLLLYQNLPLRQDKIVVEPPCIYDIKIPGMKREPYCYLNNITVYHNGNTRIMDIDLKGINFVGDTSGFSGDTKLDSVKAVIPDSYIINLSFQPILATTKNFLFTTIANDGNNKVTTGVQN